MTHVMTIALLENDLKEIDTELAQTGLDDTKVMMLLLLREDIVASIKVLNISFFKEGVSDK